MKTYLGVLLAFSVMLQANDMVYDSALIKKAKEAGLVSMPSGKKLKDIQIQKAKESKLAEAYPNKITKEQIELGKKLYFDPRISSSNLISCNTCHNVGLAGVDIVPAAIGHKWTPNPSHLNSPTVYNSVFNSAQFWDGRSAHLGDQAQGPIQAAPEMNAQPKVVVAKITSIPAYVEEFKKAYGKDVKIDFKLIADTIAMFEHTLVTPARIDKFLDGSSRALNKEEQEGLNIFINKGCAACHNGVNLGGSMQAFEVSKSYKYRKVGGFAGNKQGLVKTPTLRNVMETMPYFHNGQFWDIKDAIKEMGGIQLGVKISDDEAKKIESFFNTLTGDKPQIIYPMLPAVTNKTPKPTFR